MAEKLETEVVNSQVVKESFYEDDKIIEKTTFDLQPTLDDVAFFRDVGYNRKAPGRLVAMLPMELLEKVKEETGFDWFTATQAEKAAFLNDPANAIFKTIGGKV